MSPRRYDMTRKRALAEQTRQRIVEATLKLHGEKGIFGTSWADIAHAANVSVGTVYRHFPSLDDLVPACGALMFQRTQPPAPEDIDGMLADVRDPVARIHVVAKTLFAFYARGGSFLESDLRERQLPSVREWEAFLRSTVRTFFLEAAQGVDVDLPAKERLCFLFDVPTFLALRSRGIETHEAAAIATDLAARALDLASGPPDGIGPVGGSRPAKS